MVSRVVVRCQAGGVRRLRRFVRLRLPGPRAIPAKTARRRTDEQTICPRDWLRLGVRSSDSPTIGRRRMSRLRYLPHGDWRDGAGKELFRTAEGPPVGRH